MISFIKDLLNLGKDTMESINLARQLKPYRKLVRHKNGDIVYMYSDLTEFGIHYGGYTIKKHDPYNFMNLHNPNEWKDEPKREVFI